MILTDPSSNILSFLECRLGRWFCLWGWLDVQKERSGWVMCLASSVLLVCSQGRSRVLRRVGARAGMFVSPQNSCVEILMPRMMVLEGGSLW